MDTLKQRFQWLAIPIATAALLAAGCNGDEGADTAGSTPAATESPAAATSTSTSEPPAETPASGADVDMADLAALAGQLAEATFSATYALDATATDEALAGTWKWTQDGSNERVRFDIESEGETVIMITTSEGTTFCAEGACFSM
ncbi:MAG: hypothetical protein O2924_04285 [Chloroflexi bacterium]|nr:hypothetical protein [Chloroflexota bacterium]